MIDDGDVNIDDGEKRQKDCMSPLLGVGGYVLDFRRFPTTLYMNISVALLKNSFCPENQRHDRHALIMVNSETHQRNRMNQSSQQGINHPTYSIWVQKMFTDTKF